MVVVSGYITVIGTWVWTRDDNDRRDTPPGQRSVSAGGGSIGFTGRGVRRHELCNALGLECILYRKMRCSAKHL